MTGLNQSERNRIELMVAYGRKSRIASLVSESPNLSSFVFEEIINNRAYDLFFDLVESSVIDINEKNHKGECVAHHAVLNGDASLFHDFICHNGDPSIKNAHGQRPVDLLPRGAMFLTENQVKGLVQELEGLGFFDCLDSSFISASKRFDFNLDKYKSKEHINNNNIENSYEY